MVMVVVSRAVQGIGGGGLVTMVEVIMTDMVPLEERAIYWSVLALVWTIGTATGIYPLFRFLNVGPIIGAGFVVAGQWRW
jgi:MFS family permease